MDWIEIFEDLAEELGREPTDEEVQERYIDMCSAAYDRAKDYMKYGA